MKRKLKVDEWWSKLKHGKAMLKGLQRFEKEQRKRKHTTGGRGETG
ncbi:MAG: hypothetical protein QXW32_01565 [Nitrososphaerales archaeon]